MQNLDRYPGIKVKGVGAHKQLRIYADGTV